jgi:hypothetical protein
MVKQKRRALGARLDLRWLDLSAGRIHEVEVEYASLSTDYALFLAKQPELVRST